MGLFSRLLGNPETDLRRAQEALAEGDPRRALTLATKAARAEADRAAPLIHSARQGLIREALDKADRSVAGGHPEDAVEWLDMAIEEARTGGWSEHASEVEGMAQRRDALVAEARSLEARAIEEGLLAEHAAPEAEEVPDGDFGALDDYEILIGTFRDEVQDWYENRPQAFRDAVVALSEGRPKDALGLLDDVEVDDLVRFERGRARLLTEDHAGARDDFDAAWQGLGSEPFDFQGVLSIPVLWAEATVSAGDGAAAAARLETLGGVDEVGVPLIDVRGQALIAAGAFDDACTWLQHGVHLHPKVQSLRHLLGLALSRAGEREAAVDVLDAAVAACCSGGSCAGQPHYPPSLELLATLLLEDPEADPRRIVDALNMAAHARGGVTANIASLQARYFERVGESDKAEAARAAAEEMAKRGEKQMAMPVAPMGGGDRRAVL